MAGLPGGEPRRFGETPSGPSLIIPPYSLPGNVKRGTKRAVIASVDNASTPKFATVLIDNFLPGESGYSLPAGWGPFAAGGTAGFNYFYNNSTGAGGSWVLVDCDRKMIVALDQGVSTAAATPYYKAITDHHHSGNLNPDGFTNPQPVDHGGGETQNQLPYSQNTLGIQNAIDSNGNVIATEFPGQLLGMNSGTYTGFYQQIVTNLKDPKSFTLVPGQWIWSDWYSLNVDAASAGSSYAWGPIIYDGSGHNTRFVVWNGSGQLYRDSSSIAPLSSGGPTDTNLHLFAFGVQYVGGTTYRFQGYLDGNLLVDYTDSASTLTGALQLGFTVASANRIYHRSYSFYSPVPNSQLIGNPNSGTAPALSAGPTMQTQVGGGAGATTFDQPVSFVVTTPGQLLAALQSGLQIRQVARVSGSGSAWGEYGYLQPNALGAYDNRDAAHPYAVWSGLGVGQQWELGLQYIDQNNVLTPILSLGSTTANALSLPSVPSGFTWTTSYNSLSYQASNAGAYSASFNATITATSLGSGSPALASWIDHLSILVRPVGGIWGEVAQIPLSGLSISSPNISAQVNISGLGAGQAYDVEYRLVAANPASSVDSGTVFTTTAQKLGTPAISGGNGTGPNVLSSSVTQQNRNDSTIVRNFITFKIGDWNTSAANKPANIDKISVVYAYAGDSSTSEPTVGALIDAKSTFAAYDAAGVTFKSIVRTSAGDNVAIGIKYQYTDGTESAITWPTAINNVTDPGGTFPNTGTRVLVTTAGGHNATDFQGVVESAPGSTYQGYAVTPSGTTHLWEKTGIQPDISKAPLVFDLVGYNTGSGTFALWICANGNTFGSAAASGYLIEAYSGTLHIFKRVSGGAYTSLAAISIPSITTPVDHQLRVIAYNDGTATNIVASLDGRWTYARDASSPFSVGYIGMEPYTSPIAIRDCKWRQSAADAAALNPMAGLTKNLCPDSDIRYGLGAYWTAQGAATIAVGSNYGGGGSTCLYYPGTGSASPGNYVKSNSMYLAAGNVYVMSFYTDTTSVTSQPVQLAVYDDTISTRYGFINVGPGQNGRFQGSFTVPTTGLYRVVIDVNAVTANNGSITPFSEIQIELGSIATPYMSSIADANNYNPLQTHHPNVRNVLNGTGGTGVDGIADGTTYKRTNAATVGRFDSNGALVDSSLLQTKVPNSMAYIQDFQLSYSFTYVGVGSVNTMVIGWDNGTTNTAATIALPNGTNVNVGYNESAYTDSASNYTTPANKDLYYVLAYWSQSSGTMSFTVQKNTPFTMAQVKAAYADGGYICAQGTTSGTAPITAQSATGGGKVIPSGGRGQK